VTTTAPPIDRSADRGTTGPVRRRRTSLYAHGEPMVWLTGGALAVALFMIVGLLLLVLVQGMGTFWPGELVMLETTSGDVRLGQVTRVETFTPAPESLDPLSPAAREIAEERLAESGGTATRRLVRTGNFDVSGSHFNWVNDFEVREETHPEWALLLERQALGRFYGFPVAFLVDGEVVADSPEAAWDSYLDHHGRVRERREERRTIEAVDIGRINHRLEKSRLRVRSAELRDGTDSPPHVAAGREHAALVARLEGETKRITREIDGLREENRRFVLRMKTADGTAADVPVVEIVRAYPANRSGLGAKLGIYLSRWWEFLSDDPREANSEGGVWPAIFGTVVMTLIMCILVVPFGVLAALYLREYAKAGFIISTVRIAINNLAGVPSIVFGVFGLGFFCYIIGAPC